MSDLPITTISRLGLEARRLLERAKDLANVAGDQWTVGMLDAAIGSVETAVGLAELSLGTCAVCGDMATHLDGDGEPACDTCRVTFAPPSDTSAYDPIALGN